MIELRCPSPEDTEALGSRIASQLRPGDVLVLAGGLGVGKTLLTRGIATGLGVDEPVVSPSFVLVRQYRSGFIPLIHADVYRLASMNEFDDLDVLELAQDAVLVIEWGEAVESALPPDYLRIEFEVDDDETRLLRFVGEGAWTTRDLGGVA
ncbi:MAG TPA: tRNA (adenosine(37)-N6)-threonylcarbamoyltransferase complex ATPase subunit type 1 TsaE [Acidimicrobiia bacterium]|nr:tRNA (adenosine(37)-N6)-threonylcarbamoyltransferase complex ATPase subunit type 1 TsaE [Acidimicrobiia bacterium]